MSETESEEFEGGRLFNLYTRYVTEPESKRDVYGYTLLLGGYLFGLFGMLVYILGPSGDPPSATTFLVREIAFTTAGIGLVVTLFGIVIMLPVRRAAVGIGALGTALGLGAAGWFVMAYPQDWAFGVPDHSSAIVTIYTAGIALVAGVVVLLPVVTGERSYFAAAREVLGTDQPDIMVGEADRAGHFTIFRRGADWTWRLIDQAALASSAEGFLSRLETEDHVDRIKEKVEEAGLLEITHAAFRLHQVDEDRWSWLLMQENGSVVANSGDEYPSRQAAEGSVNALKELGPDAEAFAIEEAALEAYPIDDDWGWRLTDAQRRELAESPDRFAFSDEAHSAAEVFAARAADAPLFTLERYGIELYEEGDRWQWDLLDAEFDVIGHGTRDFDTKGRVEDAVYELLDRLDGADLIATDEPSYDLFEPSAGQWEWRLVTPEGRIAAAGTESGQSVQRVRDDARAFKSNAPGAETVEMDDQEFELYRFGGPWHWRLVDDDRNVRGHSVDEYDSRSDAADALEHLREHAPDAELIEFEEAAFQIYEADEGRWRWRLIDEDGNVLADSSEGEYESRDGAASAMSTLREYAPDADQIEIETAAFELFEEAGGWGWRLVDDIGNTIATGTHRYDDRDAAEADMDALRDEVSGLEVRVMESGVFQVYHDESDTWWWRYVEPDGTILAEPPDGFGTRHEAEDAIETLLDNHVDADIATLGQLAILLDRAGDAWGWSLVDPDREPVGKGTQTYDSRDAARSAASDFQAAADSVSVFEIREAAFIVTDGDGWRWQLLDDEHHALGIGVEAHESVEAVEAAVGTVTDLAGEASFIEYDEAAFELYQGDDGWYWQLIDDQRDVLATSADSYETRAAAETSVETVRDELAEASILEIERAAFEFHEGESGWRWRLIDETGNELAESLVAYDSRSEAREAMNTVQEYAPDAWVAVAV